MAKRSYAKRYRNSDHSHVERVLLTSIIEDKLNRESIVFIGGVAGMGKTMLLHEIARNARQERSKRVIVRIDAASVESEAYLMGRPGLLEECLLRQLRAKRNAQKASSTNSNTVVQDQEPQAEIPVKRIRLTLPPVRMHYTSRAARLIWLHISCAATAWASLFAENMHHARAIRMSPLILIDNFSFSLEDNIESFKEALRLWTEGGAKIVIASDLRTNTSLYLREFFHMGGLTLRVSPIEAETWIDKLQLPNDIDLFRYSHGIPLMINVLRRTQNSASVLNNTCYQTALRTCMEACLLERTDQHTERIKTAMVLMQTGTFQDLLALDISISAHSMGLLETEFAFLGVNAAQGTFECLPYSFYVCRDILIPLIRAEDGFALHLVDYLAEQNRITQASEIVMLMGSRDAYNAISRNPASFIEAGKRTLIQQHVLHPQNKGYERFASESTAMSHDLLSRIEKIMKNNAHGVVALDFKQSMCADEHMAQQLVYGNAILKALLTVQNSLSDLWNLSAEPLLKQKPYMSTEEKRSQLCISMTRAALNNDSVLFMSLFEEFMSFVDAARIRLDDAIYIHHAYRCGLLCGCTMAVYQRLSTLGAFLRNKRDEPTIVLDCADALLSSDLALAQLMIELPDVSDTIEGYLSELAAYTAFFEMCKIPPGIAAARFNQGFALMLSGKEAEAHIHLDYLVGYWAARNNSVGQLLGAMGNCWCTLALGGVSQAQSHTVGAKVLIERIGARGLVPYMRLLESIAIVRTRNSYNTDARLLDAELQRSALYPHSPAALEVELCLLYAMSNEQSRAETIIHPLILNMDSRLCRLLVCTARCLGPFADIFIKCLPEPAKSIVTQGTHSFFSTWPSWGMALHGISSKSERPAEFWAEAPSKKGLFKIEVFGAVTVEKNGHIINDQEWNRKSSRMLLTILALFYDRSLTRKSLLKALWPEKNSNPTSNALSTALSCLRHTLGQTDGGPEYIISISNMLSLNPALTVTDVAEFEHLARDILANNAMLDLKTAIAMCTNLIGIYKTGPCICSGLIAEVVLERLNELRDLYIECMLMAAQKALAAKEGSTALYFARAAKKVSSSYADVDVVYYKALELTHFADQKSDKSPGSETVTQDYSPESSEELKELCISKE